MIKAFDIFFILLALVIFFWGMNKRFRLWRIGRDDNRSDKMWSRVKSLLKEGIAHRRILQDRYPGVIHLLMFIGFMVPLIVILITQFIFTLSVSISRIISLALDIIALAAIVSLLLAIYRRYITRPSRLDNRPDDFAALFLILFILLTGLILEGLRLSVIGGDTQALAPGESISLFF